MKREAKGRVFLVGAGPGDPDLLTLRAVRALESSDLVLYDALVDPKVLAHAPRARRFYVGKRAGRASIAQSTINALLVRAARRGEVVTRLKAGDPFVLGRGGEEALACAAAEVRCEVIPGVTSAIAGPAAAGIPVTHRGASPGFLVLSASPSTRCETVLAGILPGSVTVVLMMALGAQRDVARFLLGRGWPASLPAAVVLGATTPQQWSWFGTLDSLEAGILVPPDRADLPGLVVLGEVVALADAIHAAARSPLEEASWPHTQAR